jgi:hypothetical protein
MATIKNDLSADINERFGSLKKLFSYFIGTEYLRKWDFLLALFALFLASVNNVKSILVSYFLEAL